MPLRVYIPTPLLSETMKSVTVNRTARSTASGKSSASDRLPDTGVQAADGDVMAGVGAAEVLITGDAVAVLDVGGGDPVSVGVPGDELHPPGLPGVVGSPRHHVTGS